MEQVDAGYTELRSYQREMKHRLMKNGGVGQERDGLNAIQGRKDIPDGRQVVRENAADGVLVVTHRIELVEQISETLSRFRVRHG